MAQQQALGIVAIGRNEGERLRRCLASARRMTDALVYVDSGSSDGSTDTARGLGAEVVALDLSIPFTAARARNAGFEALLRSHPEVKFVQFVDGDCELIDGWLEAGMKFLLDHDDCAIACGRVRERFPGRSIYNQLCDWEWETLAGQVKSCGGNAMARVQAFRSVHGFTESLIAGEEPELCLRLRREKWAIHCLAVDMVWHDAAMTRFVQWWKRSMRSGYAFAQGAWMHGASPERHWRRETSRAIFWGGLLPLLLLASSVWIGSAALLGLLLYPTQVLRLSQGRGGWRRAAFLVLGKFPECAGVLKFHLAALGGTTPRIIEYK